MSGCKMQTVFFTMVNHPAKGWMRVGKAYGSRDAAREWLPFVRGAWRGMRVKVVQCTLRWINGQLDEKSRTVLDKRFNMDAPNEPMAGPGDKAGFGQASGCKEVSKWKR
jgi:hypothetical protein